MPPGVQARARNAAAARVFVADGYNSDDEVYATDRAMQEAAGGDNDESSHSRQVGPLAALDHDSIDYQPFAKDFYTPLPEIASMPPAQVTAPYVPMPNICEGGRYIDARLCP